MQNVIARNALLRRVQDEAASPYYSLNKAPTILIHGIALLVLLIYLDSKDGKVEGFKYDIQFQDSSNGKYRYELHWIPSSFVGAMATCQSRGQGQGILTPLTTYEELGLVLTLLGGGCCPQNYEIEEFIFVGLTTLGNKHSISFLDRPWPGSSTALLRNVSTPGRGFVNGSWPDDPAITSAAATPVSDTSVLDTTPVRPLCAAIRLQKSRPPEDSATARAQAATSQLQLAVCSNDVVRGLSCTSHSESSKNVSYQLEIHFHDCDGGPLNQGGGGGSAAAHAFVCRVPAFMRPPSQPASEQPPAPPSETRPAAPDTTPAASDQNTELSPSPTPTPTPTPTPPTPTPPTPTPTPTPTTPVNNLSPPVPAVPRPRLATTSPPLPSPGEDPPRPVPSPAFVGAVGTPQPSGGVPLLANATLTLSAAHVMPKCDTEVLNVSGVAIRYLACHVAASWSESAQLCTQLLVGGTLAAFESQAQMDAVFMAFSRKDLGGMHDFWFGLVSGTSPEQPSGPSEPTLEYVLTDPRVAPILPLLLWTTGGLVTHSSCLADPEAPPPSQSSDVHSGTQVSNPPIMPTPHPPTPRAPISTSSTSAPARHDQYPDPVSPFLPTTTSPPVLAPGTTPVPVIPPSTALLPQASGCCASLVLSSSPATSNSTYGTGVTNGSVLRACCHKIRFICQARVAAESTETTPTSGGLSAGGGSGATTLLAGLFLDALESSYKGSYRIFMAKLDMRLIGAPYSSLSGPFESSAVEGFCTETARQLSQATRLPAWSFAILELRNGSVVATINLTVRGLPRATRDNFTEFVSASLIGRKPAELFSGDFIATWSIQDCVVTILGVWEIGDPFMPASLDRSSSRRALILIVGVVVGVVLVAAALGLILLVRRRRQQQRYGTPVYLSSLGDADPSQLKINRTSFLSPQLLQSLPSTIPEASGSATQDALTRHPATKPFSQASSSSLMRIAGPSSAGQWQQPDLLQFASVDTVEKNGMPRYQQQQQQQQQEEAGFRSHAAMSEAGLRTQAGTGSGSMRVALYGGVGDFSESGKITGRFNLTPSRSTAGRSDADPAWRQGRGLQPPALDGFGLASRPVVATMSGRGGGGGGGFLSGLYGDVSMPNSPTVPRSASRP
ncbi:hypothetical protein Vafri_18090 [Volvox africanus]|uniref:Uncharacterized protein n=1 Tax=Volvox africanus TaxID=51714 RepID=A0A8J4FAU6_9CHLO|nr:hypothetical protein Vafri_18090 [Volvox africanus]